MEAGRKLREEQYAALKDKEWEDTLRREAELHRSVCSGDAPVPVTQHTHLVSQMRSCTVVCLVPCLPYLAA